MQFPFFAQHDAMDCGPACLRMVAAFHGRFFSLEGLRERAHLSREGVSLLGISEAAESIGLRSTGVMVSFDELMTAPLPCIVHWNQQHFVVVYAIKSRKKGILVHVADPAGGKQQYSREEFCRCWISSQSNNQPVGIALLLEPTPEFYAQEGDTINRRGFAFLAGYIRPYRPFVTQVITGLVVGSLLQLVLPFLTQSIVDVGISTNDISYIWLVLIAQLMLIVSSTAIDFIRGWILLHLGTRVNIALISDFLIKLMRLPLGYFDTKMTGDILQRINDHTRIQHYLTNSSLNILFSAFTILIFSIVLLLYNFTIFGIFILGSLVYFAWVWLFMKRREALDHKNFALQSANQSNVIQLVNGMQEIRLNGCEQQKRWEWERIQARMFRLRIKGLALAQYQDSGGVLINQTKNLLITALVAKLVIDGSLTLGMMLAVQYIIGQLNSPVDQLISFMRESQDAKLSLERLGEIHEKEEEESAAHPAVYDIPANQDLVLENIVFGYDTTRMGSPVIKGITLRIPAGKQTAIVGSSGSGKTTLVKLMLGFYPLQQGEIRLGNHRLDTFSMREWRKKCGVVMQDGFIFSDTVARNIAPGAERIDKEKLLHAAGVANIRNYIESLPLSYNTKIGQEGIGLSQGQKQRILIARAVYKEPEIVFLDEATNALDTNNEREIMQQLGHFLNGRTSVVVAHRLSTVRNADQIVVIDNGNIVEQGTHEELLKLQGAYHRLVKNQLDV